MSAELYHDQQLEDTHAPETEFGGAAAGEQRGAPPILAHFYGYCEANGLDIRSVDPQTSEQLAKGAWGYIKQAMDARNARLAASPSNTTPLWPHVPERYLMSRLHGFYTTHGATVPEDGVRRKERADYLDNGLRNTKYYKERFRELAYTEELATHLSYAGHQVATDGTVILLAVTGVSLQGLRTR